MWNSEILKKITDYDYNKDDILVYLLSLYYGLKPKYIPELVKKQTNIMGVVNRDFKERGIQWDIPLFDSKSIIVDDQNPNWDWVWTEYRSLWKEIDPKRVGDKQGCLKKMQKFFSENPLVRKDDIIRAANVYLEDFKNGKNNPKFLIHADYFIKKNEQSRLAQSIELLMNNSEKKSEKHMRMRGLL